MDQSQPDAKLIETWRDEEMGVIAIRRAHDANRTDRATMRAIENALEQCENDAAIRVVAITGDDKNFSCGGRIDGFAERDVEKQMEFARAFITLQARMACCKKPLLAVVEGDCICGGMSLLDACDLAVAAEHVKFGFAEIEAGIFPFLAMASFYGRLPSKQMLDLFYSGRRMAAHEALAAGLLNRVVGGAQIWEEARRMARELSARSAHALAIGRQTYYGMANMPLAARLEYAQGMLVTMLAAKANKDNS